MKLIKNIIVLLVALIVQTSFAQNYNFKRFSVEEGLSQYGVYALEEDAQGRLWIGLENGGVEIYDGFSFKPLRTSVNIGKDIRTIFKSSSDDMWIGSSYEGATLVSKDTTLNFNIENGMFSNHIRDFAEDFEGNTWIATVGGGIAVVDGNEIVRVLGKEEGLLTKNVKSLLVCKDGKVWAGTDKGIFVFNGFKVEKHITSLSGLGGDRILDLTKDASENIWVGTTKGVSVVLPDTIVNLGKESGLKHSRIKSILIDRKNQVWIGTKEGIGKIKVKNLRARKIELIWYSRSNGLSHNRVRCLYEDVSGAIWIGTFHGGVNKFFNESFSIYNHTHGLSDDLVSVVTESAFDSTLWIGTDGAGVNVWNKGVSKQLSSETGLVSDFIQCMTHTKRGRAFIGTSEGISIVDSSYDISVVDSYDGYFVDNSITSLVSGGDYTIGLTGAHEIFVFNDTSVIEFDSLITQKLKNHLNRNVNYVFYEQNAFWFATDSSLVSYYINNGAVKERTVLNISFCEFISGTETAVFGFNGNNELFQVRGNIIEYISILDPSQVVHFLLVENNNSIWVGVDNKVLNYKLKKGKIQSKRSFSNNEGFMGVQSLNNAAVKSFDGSIWIGTIKGLLNVDANNYKGIQRDLPVYFVELLHEGRSVDWAPYSDGYDGSKPVGLELPEGFHELTFKFCSYHLKNPDEVEYKYKLEGAEDEFHYGFKNEVTFAALPSGDYKLVVYARTQWGDWSKTPLVFQFSIVPPWYKTIPFISGLIICGVLLVFFFLNYRTKKLIREKEKLEAIVADRTRDLHEEKEKSESLLLNILPAEIANELKAFGTAKTKKYNKASVLFTDFKGFTKMSAEMDPIELVKDLDEIFGAFDEVIERNSLEKIKTIGDAYMCASGIPEYNDKQAVNAVVAGLQLIEFMDRFNLEKRKQGKPEWNIRIGIHTGELIAGVVGKKKFAYDVWGDTVNIASRMESNSEPGRLNISADTYELIKEFFETEYRGEIEAKNRGLLEMYFVNRLKEEYSKDELGFFPKHSSFMKKDTF